MSPIYLYQCQGDCKGIMEKFQWNSEDVPLCCGLSMKKLPTAQAMIKMKGEGGYPSLRNARLKDYGRNLQEDDKKRKTWV